MHNYTRSKKIARVSRCLIVLLIVNIFSIFLFGVVAASAIQSIINLITLITLLFSLTLVIGMMIYLANDKYGCKGSIEEVPDAKSPKVG